MQPTNGASDEHPLAIEQTTRTQDTLSYEVGIARPAVTLHVTGTALPIAIELSP